VQPNSPYSAEQVGRDLLVRAFHKNIRIPRDHPELRTTTARTQHPEKFIPLFITNAIEGKPAAIYGTARTSGLDIRRG